MRCTCVKCAAGSSDSCSADWNILEAVNCSFRNGADVTRERADVTCDGADVTRDARDVLAVIRCD